jgi:copper chaperone
MLRFSVKGMTCGHCVGAVQKAAQSAAPGAEVRVDLPTGTVETSKGDADAIKTAIEDAGYTVVSYAG